MSQNHYQDEFEDNKNTTYVSRQMNYLPEVNISVQDLNHGLKFVHDLVNVLKSCTQWSLQINTCCAFQIKIYEMLSCNTTAAVFQGYLCKTKIRRFMEIIFVMLAVIIKNTINTNIDFCLWNGIKI